MFLFFLLFLSNISCGNTSWGFRLNPIVWLPPTGLGDFLLMLESVLCVLWTFYYSMGEYVQFFSNTEITQQGQTFHNRPLRFPCRKRRTGIKQVSKRIWQKGRTRGEAKGQVGRAREAGRGERRRGKLNLGGRGMSGRRGGKRLRRPCSNNVP